jgi:hypothetical protein
MKLVRDVYSRKHIESTATTTIAPHLSHLKPLSILNKTSASSSLFERHLQLLILPTEISVLKANGDNLPLHVFDMISHHLSSMT